MHNQFLRNDLFRVLEATTFQVAATTVQTAMNKRPHPSAGLGGAKPGVSNAGQNPPLPAGPIPNQQQAQPVYDQNAHAAAWQAYYQVAIAEVQQKYC
jgi:hypothetical protein